MNSAWAPAPPGHHIDLLPRFPLALDVLWTAHTLVAAAQVTACIFEVNINGNCHLSKQSLQKSGGSNGKFRSSSGRPGVHHDSITRVCNSSSSCQDAGHYERHKTHIHSSSINSILTLSKPAMFWLSAKNSAGDLDLTTSPVNSD